MTRSFSGRAALAGTLLLLASAPLAGQAPLQSPEEFLGYALGEHFTDYNGVRRYSQALADASPLVELQPYGVTPERRELFQLVIATPEHRQRLDQILALNAELLRPETPAARAQQIAESNPAVVYFSYGVHGNESSSSEAALWTAWDLARGAPSVAGVLDSLVIIMDPVTNPDGRDRYVQWFRSVVGPTPDPDPQTREHREPWPGGRFNHYLFDLNRDWSWLTQPETRARMATWNRWNPAVHVDFHEMSPNSSYFFFPAAAPINPIYPPYVLEWGKRFGEGNARAFDEQGWGYFTGDNYDLFYPGYGDSWPSLVGAIGMTYEQAGGGAGGLAFRQTSGDTLTLRDRAMHHWTAGTATLRTTAAGKSRLLLDYAAAQRGIGAGKPDVLLVPAPDTTRIRALVEHLRRQGIEVERAERGFRAGADPFPEIARRAEFPAGSYRVRARQPRGRLATTLLQPRTKLNAEYSYDISAWSLPYAYGVEAYQIRGGAEAGWSPVPMPGEIARQPAPAPGYGYLVLPGDASPALVAFLRGGGRVRVLSREGTFGGRRFPAGTWFLPSGGNESLQARVTAAGLGGRVTPVASGLATSGIDLGSAYALPVRLPRVAVLAGDGVTPTSYGAHWYFLEQTLGLPFHALLAGELGRLDLSEYDVIVIPDAAGRAVDSIGRGALRGWVRAGGRLVGVAGGAEIAGVIAGVELREAEEVPDSVERARLLAGRLERERQEWVEEVPGAILPTRLDPAHPLAWGAGMGAAGDRLFVLHQGELAFEPDEGVEAVAYFPSDLEATSGVISEANLERLEEALWLATKRLEQGSVVLFADDPLFRLFWKAAHPLYVNALLLGPVGS